MIRRLFFSICLLGILSSCVSKKNISYFQGLDQVHELHPGNNLEIQPDDVLTIRVSAPEQEAALPFNLTKSVGSMAEGASAANVELETYLVANDGTIQFPVLGKIAVEGYTNQELSLKMKELLEVYVQDPIVNVRILNFQISVLGEVRNPGTFSIQDDHISLSKALGLAGDIPLSGDRTNVLVMRQNDNKIVHEYLDLTNPEILESPFYNLQQNDVVYIDPNGPKRQTAGYLGTASTYLSIFSVIISLVILLTN
ncbi:polysaccharide biosynthesis/export family protein [Christiangramia sp. ASW11-125]|uniref:polysaccharide biosynthesis/export family protein n=1 Tax=Christiangramia sp. ASW11-125 TaxID=3400701 RepID=UPI003AAC32CA